MNFACFPFDVPDTSVMTIEVVDDLLGSYEYWQLSRELNALDVPDEVLYRPFDTLSKGEQTKVMLAALFLQENSFLLIDEPTNHLDAAGQADGPMTSKSAKAGTRTGTPESKQTKATSALRRQR